MKKLLLLMSLPVVLLASCDKCDDDLGDICTEEFRMITLKVKAANGSAVVLDSFHTTRVSNNQRFQSSQQTDVGTYVVLDDSFHPSLKNAEDNFRFRGYKNNQLIVDQTYKIAGDNCHIYKKMGVDSVEAIF